MYVTTLLFNQYTKSIMLINGKLSLLFRLKQSAFLYEKIG